MADQEKEKRISTLKLALEKLQDERKKIEAKLLEHRRTLEANNVGMNDSLVDKEDYPANHIDVVAVRLARQQIIMLENDAKAIFLEIADKLNELHAVSC